MMVSFVIWAKHTLAFGDLGANLVPMMDLRKPLVALIVATSLWGGADVSSAQSIAALAERQQEIDTLLTELAKPDLEIWESVEKKVIRLWSQSGSATGDLLLQRGQEAIEAGDYPLAIEHLTALTDHAPDFAEGWNARATAFFLAEEFGLALADIEQVLVLNPHHFGALSGVGVMFEQLGDPQLALDAMRAAQQINPHREPVNNAIERLQAQLGETTL